MRARSNPLLFTSLVLATTLAHAQVASDDADWERYVQVLRASTLEWSTSEPFLIRAEYQLYDLDGTPASKGTVEAFWPATGPNSMRISSSTLTVDTSSDPIRTHTRERFLVEQALRSVLRPFPLAIKRNDLRLETVGQKIGTVPIDCFSIVPIGTARTAATTAYCTNPDNQIVDISGDHYVIAREDFRHFRNHEVPMDITVSYEENRAISLHVTELDALKSDAPVEAAAHARLATVYVASTTIAGMQLKHRDPKYPFEAKMKRISGVVVLAGVIGTDGKITALDVVASPNPLLSKSALDAVKKWEYRPYTLEGKAVPVETTISVNYSFGRE